MTHNSKEFEKVVDEAIYRHANPHLNGKEWDAKTTRKNLLEAHQAAIRASNKALLEELKSTSHTLFDEQDDDYEVVLVADINAKLAAIEKEGK